MPKSQTFFSLLNTHCISNFSFGGKELLIGVTEPRRIAAISVSGRVAEELSLSSREVAYQVRLSDGQISYPFLLLLNIFMSQFYEIYMY